MLAIIIKETNYKLLCVFCWATSDAAYCFVCFAVVVTLEEIYTARGRGMRERSPTTTPVDLTNQVSNHNKEPTVRTAFDSPFHHYTNRNDKKTFCGNYLGTTGERLTPTRNKTNIVIYVDFRNLFNFT